MTQHSTGDRWGKEFVVKDTVMLERDEAKQT